MELFLQDDALPLVSSLFLDLMFLSVQDSTILQITVCVWSVTAIPWELHSLVVRSRPDSVSAPILQLGGDVVTSVLRCSTVSTLVWAGSYTH